MGKPGSFYATARWQRQRRRQLSISPLCIKCLKGGFITQAREVDHIEPLSKGGSKQSTNLQSLCKSCHSKKTRDDNSTKKTVNIHGFKTVSDLRAYLITTDYTPAEQKQAEDALRERICLEKELSQRRL